MTVYVFTDEDGPYLAFDSLAKADEYQMAHPHSPMYELEVL